jgi:hypothetical protein
MHFLNNPFSVWFWLLWAVFLVWQNFAFTNVSRARASGSLKRHFWAAQQSNGVWFVQFLFVVSAFNSIIRGVYGWKMTLFAVFYYTAFTTAGSLYGHYQSLKKEKGKEAVGFNKKYAQIPIEDWNRVQSYVSGVLAQVPVKA